MNAESKQHTRGTHRVVSPGETVARAKKLMPRLGITRVANVTGLDIIGIPVVTVSRPNSRSLAVSQGKGLDLDAARASGLMESIEFHHAEHVTRPLLLCSWAELRRRQRVVAVEALPSVRVSAFHPHRDLLWVEGRDLLGADSVFVPYEMVHTNYTLPLPTGSGCFVMSSNGLASGNTSTEAVLHGLCELVERDAATLWACASPAQKEAGRVALDSIDDEDCRGVLRAYARAGVAVGVWDISSDVGIPAFHCMIADEERSKLRLLYATRGMGCHPVREVALLRALTEAAQARLTFISGSRDDSGVEKYRLGQDERVWQEAQRLLGQSASRRFDDIASFPSDDVAADLGCVLGRLSAVGLTEAVAVDLTQDDIGIPVVRMIVPGLEPLYEVPGYVPGARARRVLTGCAEAPR